MKSPFKFLDAYQLVDREVFFGREEEISGLYNLVAQNRLVLIYGQSGTGKTSLIQCGLASRFDITDWYPLYIRRQQNLNRSLDQRLAQASGQSGLTAAQALEEIYTLYLRPVYLIFDQLEEIFILGSQPEQEEFIHTVRAILQSNIPSRILFVIREEFLAHLYGFERVIPTLFDRRIRVEPMGIGKVKEVLQGTFKSFNIVVREPADASYELIIDNVSGEKTGIQLTYLQVYLDILYREDFSRTYSDTQLSPGEWPPLEFTLDEIQTFGQMENVLERFLQEQREALQNKLKQQFPQIERDAANKVLDAFVSEEGTKRPIRFEWKGEDLFVEQRWATLFAPLPPQALGVCCRMLEYARLLRVDENQMELAHDTLATLIDQQRSATQRQLIDIRRRIATGYKVHLDTDGTHFFDRVQLARIQPFLDKIALEPEWAAFLDASQAEVERRENEERKRVERELRLTEEKLEAEKKAKQRRTLFLWIIAGVAMIAIIAMIYAMIQRNQAKTKELTAKDSEKAAIKAKSEAVESAKNAQQAKEEAVESAKNAQQAAAAAKNSRDSALVNEQRAMDAEVRAKSSRDSALVNEQRAKDAEGRANKSLIEVSKANEQVNTLNNQLTKSAEEIEKKRSETEKQTAKVVQSLLEKAEIDIIHLRYKEAEQKLASAAALGQRKPEVARALMEIAYFYSESGHFPEALNVLGQIASIDNNYIPPAYTVLTDTIATRKAIRDALLSVDRGRVAELDARYYPDFISVQGGTLAFGCEKGISCENLPRIQLSDFRLARTETTVWQYGLYCAAENKDILETRVKSWGEIRGNDPVVLVSWFDAIKYANWLSKQLGRKPVYQILSRGINSEPIVTWMEGADGFRLPTDAEWEFAAKGGIQPDNTRYSGGDDLNMVSWYSKNSGGRTQPVANSRMRPNRLGLYDMSGNVWEWCWDHYKNLYRPQPTAKDPTGPVKGDQHVIRGGSWYSKLEPELNVTNRASWPPLFKGTDTGFRLAGKK